MVQGQHGAIPSNPGIRPRLTEIASVFARYGNLTFGGGSATIAVLQHEIETGRPWINRDQFRLCFGLSRLTPGTNLLAFCTGRMIRVVLSGLGILRGFGFRLRLLEAG